MKTKDINSKSFKKYFRLILPVFIFSCIFAFSAPVSAEQAQNETTLEKNKKEILRDIELFEHSLHKTKGCVSEAQTPDQMERCRTDETTLNFQKVQDSMSELGMTPEERRLKRLRRGQ